MCRSEFSLFCLKDIKSNQLVHPCVNDFSALVGCVFLRDRQFGLQSFHFEDASTAYINCESEITRFDDGTQLPSRKYFEGAQWHEAKRILRATVNWAPKTVHGSQVWSYIMQFSTDLGYVCGGSLQLLRSERDCLMDGEWKVVWENGNSARILLEGGCWELWGIGYKLDFSISGRVSFVWPVDSTIQLCDVEPSSVRELNSQITWTTNHQDYPTISWVRVGPASTAAPPPLVVPFSPLGLQYMRASQRPQVSARINNNTIWGNCYVQSLMLGLASYHFGDEGADGEDRAYISYEHPSCALWPSLDSGAPVPARVPFRDVEWDAERRIFRGTIDWLATQGTTWQGVEQFVYEMVLDPQFEYIASGWCRQVLASGGEEPIDHFGEELCYVHAAAEDLMAARRAAGETLEAAQADYLSRGATRRILRDFSMAWRRPGSVGT